MNIERNIKQIRLKEFGLNGQQRLAESAVLVVGAGGLGIPVCQYLNAMGVGHLGIIDGDVIELSNLHRQPLFDPASIGLSKVRVLRQWLHRQNPETEIQIYDAFLTPENALHILSDYQIVIDATDNLTTRYLIDDASLILNFTWIYGALHGFEGQVSVFNYNNGPTYRCLFPNLPVTGEIQDCNTLGTLGVLPGIIGNLQALEAIKVIANLPGILSGKVLIYHGLDQEIRHLKLRRDPNRAVPNATLRQEENSCNTIAGGLAIDLWLESQRQGTIFQLIDVREPDEFNTDHLDGAVNIPLLELANRLSDLEESRQVLFMCKSGARSSQAYMLFQNTSNGISANWLIGGLTEYRNRNL